LWHKKDLQKLRSHSCVPGRVEKDILYWRCNERDKTFRTKCAIAVHSTKTREYAKKSKSTLCFVASAMLSKGNISFGLQQEMPWCMKFVLVQLNLIKLKNRTKICGHSWKLQNNS